MFNIFVKIVEFLEIFIYWNLFAIVWAKVPSLMYYFPYC